MQDLVWGGKYGPFSVGGCQAVPSVTYHAELGLQLDLQPLQGASQVGDLGLAALQLFGVNGDLTVQLFSLRQGKHHVRSVGAKAVTAFFCVF